MIKHKETSEEQAPPEKKAKTLKSTEDAATKKKTFEKKKFPKKIPADTLKKNLSTKSKTPQKPEDWNEYKKKKKEVRLKRKQSRSGFEVIIQAKEMGEQLRCKKIGPVERNKIINKLHSLLKNGDHYKKFVLAHDTARIVQWLLKYSSDFVKKQISEELLPISVPMILSKYGIFCLKRLMKYTDSATRGAIIDKFYGNAVKLASHALSAPVFEHIYSTYASPQQKQHLIQEFYGEIYKNSKDNNIKHLRDVFTQSPDLKSATLSAVKANLNRILDKELLDSGLVQSVINQFLSECSAEDKADLISQLAPHIVVISNSKDGSRAAMQCFWNGTNKDRKQIVKTVKEHVTEMAKHEHAHCMVIAILDAADDTVLLHKAILGEILKSAKDLAVNEWGRKVLLWLMAPGDSKCFHPLFIKELEEGRKNSNCKKDIEVRRKEIADYSIDTLVNLICDEPQFWFKNSSLAYELLTIVKACKENWFKKAIGSIAKVIVDPEWKIQDQPVFGIEEPGIHLVLKKLLRNDQQIEDKENGFGAAIVDCLTKETLNLWLSLNRGCFLLVSIIENSPDSVKNSLKIKLKKQKKLLEEQVSTGSKILLKKIT